MTDVDRDLPNEQAPANPMSAGCSRVFVYKVVVPFAMIVAFGLGSSRVEKN